MSRYSRWQNVFRSERLNSELDDELQHHPAQLVVAVAGLDLDLVIADRQTDLLAEWDAGLGKLVT